MLPVVAEPSVSVWPLVVPMLPVASSDSALLLAPEMDAVGVPPATFTKANFALVVAVDPSRKSWVVIRSLIAPLFCSNGEPPLATGRMPVTSEAPFKFTREVVSTPLVSVWTMP